MAASQLDFRIARIPALFGRLEAATRRRKKPTGVDLGRKFGCWCSGGKKSGEKLEEYQWRLISKRMVRVNAYTPAMPFASPQHASRFVSKQEKIHPRCALRNSGRQSRDTPPERDTGIASEKDWGIDLLNDDINEFGTNEDGSTWFRESGEDLSENGYRCRWTRMGGRSHGGSSEWKETWWEKSDWSGYKELGVEKSGRNVDGDSWWETWREVLYQDEWSNLAKIERSAQKQAKSGAEDAGWHEKWWEKYDAKGWTEKGAHKYGRLNEQSWWEKWGEHYDGRGSVLKWTDKWAETELGTKWGDKWEEKFFSGVGSRQGETWHVSSGGENVRSSHKQNGQGHGEKNTMEMARYTSTGRARRVKTGILLWMRKPATRLNLTTGGQTWLVTQPSCFRSNPAKDHRGFTRTWTSSQLLLGRLLPIPRIPHLLR